MLVALCLSVRGGWAEELFDTGKPELSEGPPSALSSIVFLLFSIGQVQPDPKDNFLICRSKPECSG